MTTARSSLPIDGVLLLDKPAGPTSHDLVARLRRALGQRRIGHAGTLDPFATGLLVCCVGRATRLARFLAACDKAYTGLVRFGFATDTADATGRPLGEPVVPSFTREALEAAVASLTGAFDQVPPMYSAKKREGRRLYELARAGLEVERPAAPVRVESWSVGGLEQDRLPFGLRVSAGTYVRALAEELGRLVGCPAHLESLRRVGSGPFSVEEALAVGPGRDDGPSPAEARERLVPLEELPLPLGEARLSEEGAVRAFLHGGRLDAELWTGPHGEEGVELAVRDPSGLLIGVGRVEANAALRPAVVLREPT